MGLNTEQQELKSRVAEFLSEDSTGYFFILGAGGTGKTYTLCRSLDNYNKRVVFLGATNKVTTVLKNSLQASHYTKQSPIKTIDSFLRFKIEKDHENKSTISYKFPSPKEIPDLIVIDEISLISFQKFNLLEKLKSQCKIILIGDHLQLPPIEEDRFNIVRNSEGFQVSRIFLSSTPNNSFTLTIQNRQKDGTGLSELVSGFRNHMHLRIPAIPLAEKKQNGNDVLYFYVNDKNLKEEIKKENCVAVCFKNLSVLNFNWLIGSTKSMRKDYRLNEINAGDRLMFDQFYSHKDISFFTSNIVHVKSIEKNIEERFEIKEKMVKVVTYHKITVIDEDGSEKNIRYIHGGLYGHNGGGLSQSVYGQRRTYLEHISKNKNISENKKYLSDLNTRFSDYQNSFAKLKRPYAITAHKAQGSTYDTVIIPAYDFYALDPLDSNQLLYVALSRAKNKIIFVNKNDQFDETGKRRLFSEFEKQSIASNYDYKCNECKSNLVEREFQIDHIQPLSKGGKNSVENLQPLCLSCHKRKTAFERGL